jgi:hypothetical protein
MIFERYLSSSCAVAQQSVFLPLTVLPAPPATTEITTVGLPRRGNESLSHATPSGPGRRLTAYSIYS